MTKTKPGFLLLSTNRSCFLCYKVIPACSTIPLSSSLKNIYRLLKVNLVETISLPDDNLLPILERQDVHVSICQGCSILNQTFSQLYREMEKIRMKLDDSLEAISEKMVMSQWDRSESASAEGTSLESGDKPAKSHSETVENLRTEIMLKYRSYKKTSQPRIRIPKMTLKTAKMGAVTNLDAEAVPTSPNLIKQEPPSLAEDDHDNDPEADEDEEARVTPDISAVKTESSENGDLLQDRSEPLRKSNECESTGGLRRKEWEAVFIEGRQGAELPHPCKFCWNSFSTQFELANHVSKAHSSGPKVRSFTCPFCQKSFLTKVNLAQHQKGVHKIQRQFPCQFCRRLFSTEDIQIKHETFVCKSNPNVRARQEEGASSNSALASGSSHEDMDVVSLTPVASSSSRRKQTFHTRSHFTCALCGGFFTYEADLAKHQTQDCEAVVGASQPVPMEPKSAQAASANSKGCITTPRKPVKLGNKSNPKPKPKAQKGYRMYSKVNLPPRSPPQIPTFRYKHVCQHCKRIFSTEDFLFKHQRLACQVLVRSSPTVENIYVEVNAHGTLDAAVAVTAKSEHVEVEDVHHPDNNQNQLGDGEEMEESILPD